MIVLFDKYTEYTKKLQETMKQLEISVEIAVLDDDGFLPQGISSPYEYFISRQNAKEHVEKECSIDSLKLPKFWEIRLKGSSAGIFETGYEKATVYFTEPAEKKIVQRVEWYTEEGWIYRIDYYNKYGLKYASAFLDADKKIESKVYYSDKNEEVIVSQPQNDVITLTENRMVKAFFHSYNEFLEYFIAEAGNGDKRALFVQEEPCRLLDIKSDEKSIWDFVLFSDREFLEKYMKNGGTEGYMFYDIPEEYPKNHENGNVMILTASDQIEKLEELVLELPEIVFHIAAHTQVSDKLHKLAEQKNVRVYPGIRKEDLEVLWNTCDFYLDINHYREIDDAVNTANQKNLLIMGFENTMHRRELVVEGYIYPPQEYRKMALMIKHMQNDRTLIQKVLLVQQKKRKKLWNSFLGRYQSGGIQLT